MLVLLVLRFSNTFIDPKENTPYSSHRLPNELQRERHDKTEFIEFCKTTTKDPLDGRTLLLDGRPIRRVNESKFLGVHIDSSLSWRPHIHKITTKISQTIGILGRARSFMNETQLSLLYNTMILPHLQYCIINWGNFKVDFNVGLGNKILKLQKCLVRLISNTHRISHADPLFHTRGILKIEHLYEQSLRIFSYKLFKKNYLVRCHLYSGKSNTVITHAAQKTTYLLNARTST